MKSRLQQNAPLAPLTTFNIGGPARYFLEAISEQDVVDALDFASTQKLPLFVLGGGSNLLVSDAGFDGLVLRVSLKGIAFEPQGNELVMVRAAAGEDWDALVARAVEQNLAGVECLSGIPGSVGGTPVQNVGAYGQETSDVLLSVEAVDRRTGAVVDLSRADCGFTYRSSIFNTTEKERYIVLRVIYSLRKGGAPTGSYADVRRKVESLERPPTLADVRAAVREIRAGKGMLITPGDPDCRSAGSFFKNPIITESAYNTLQQSVTEPVPRYPAAAGYVKTAAAWLIEHAGFTRGFSIGPAGISGKHTLALVNKGGAQAADIIRLAQEIRLGVEERFGISLVPEPVFLGFPPPSPMYNKVLNS